ncbi:MAG: hypothetical protein J7M18_08635, partial [Candidatus Eremiobacteraeota bacterium]|nr:hypothetical protein [Candidatus Eremiobacteraeota bacterium]
MSGKVIRRLAIFLVLVCLLAGESIGDLLHEEWHKTLFWDEPITFERYTVEKIPDGNLKITTNMWSVVLQDSVTQKTESSIVCIVKDDFTPVSFTRKEKTAREETVIGGEIKEGKLKLVFFTPGTKREEIRPFPPGTYLFSTIEEVIRHEELTPGKVLTYSVFDESVLNFGVLEVRVIGKEKHKVGDEMPELLRLHIENTMLPGVI